MESATPTDRLKQFRRQLYECFHKRADAIMNLLDALTTEGRRCQSVVQLSKADAFKRQYSSITDAITQGLSRADWPAIETLLYQQGRSSSRHANRFVLDCTSNPRQYARKLADRSITHAPNPAPGNKPITVGHQYSVLTLLPDDTPASQKHWLMPLSARRVSSDKKGNEVGMNQLSDLISSQNLTDQLTLSIGDCLYGSEPCRVTAAKQDNLVHIFRLNSKRNVFCAPESPTANKSDCRKAGRRQEFGAKMNLGQVDTHPPYDEQVTTQWTSRRGKAYEVSVVAWRNKLLRGSRSFRSSEHPLNVIRITVTDSEGKSLYKRPLWLGVFGKRRDEVSLIDAYESYRSRYDIEHFYRFSKHNLLLDGYQTPEVSHEQSWWSLCLLAYAQLYLAKGIVPALPEPWERYLPVYKQSGSEGFIGTPSQTQRGFSKVLERIGTPARDCVARGKPRGRLPGESPGKRVEQSVIFKSKKPGISTEAGIVFASDQEANFPNPKKIEQLILQVQESLGKLDMGVSEFSKLLVNST